MTGYIFKRSILAYFCTLRKTITILWYIYDIKIYYYLYIKHSLSTAYLSEIVHDNHFIRIF